MCKGVNVKKVLLFLACFFGFYSSVLANGGPKPWQMDFRPAATPTMEKVVAFHNFVNPIIIAIAVFVIVLMAYIAIRFSAKNNPKPVNERVCTPHPPKRNNIIGGKEN